MESIWTRKQTCRSKSRLDVQEDELLALAFSVAIVERTSCCHRN